MPLVHFLTAETEAQSDNEVGGGIRAHEGRVMTARSQDPGWRLTRDTDITADPLQQVFPERTDGWMDAWMDK